MSSITSYFQGVATELKKVSWPTFPTVMKHFASVIVGLIFAIVVVGVFDYAFFKLLAFIIK